MQPDNADNSRHLLGIAMIAVIVSFCACGTTAKVVTSSTKAPTPAASSSSTSTTSTTSTTTPQTCAGRAAETFVFIDSVTQNSAGGFSVIDNRATLVCGGPDDFHWNSAPTTESSTVVQGATIEVLGSPGSTLAAPIAADQFVSYMATDHNSRIFLVTGPLDAITELQEQFHP